MVLAQRDRGELDWDQQSVAVTLNHASSVIVDPFCRRLIQLCDYHDHGLKSVQPDIELSPLLYPSSQYYHNNASFASREAPTHWPQGRSLTHSPSPSLRQTPLRGQSPGPQMYPSQQQLNDNYPAQRGALRKY